MAVSASRRFTMTRALEEALLQHFICQKLEIAYAINKPFPFLEGLRDNLFITERLYRESLEACGNLVPVSRVVYNILTKLQTTFNLSFLELLFSQINLREYPNLMMTLKSFERVVTSHGGQSRIREIPLEASANPSRKCSLQTLLPLLPACQHPAPSCPSCAPSVSEPKAPAQRSAEILNEPPSPAGLAVSLSGVIEEGRLTPVARDDSSEPSEPKELQEAAGTPSNKKGKKRKRNIWSTPKRRRQKKSVPREISDDISEIDEGKRPQEPPSGSPRITRSKEKKRKIQSWSSSKKRQKKSLPREEKKGKVVCSSSTRCQRNILAEEKPKEDSLDFHAPKLPVTCGKAKGILYKEKMKQGSSEKCIQNEKGVWFTPREFEMEGKRAQSRYWKRSVLCGGKSLEQLMKNGLLLCPPRSLKREEDPKECMVCCRGGLLLCCDTCPRAFHENCHIPPTEAERSPWSCTFCRMKERSGSQQCHGESELLTRQMEPEDQLKCEFLLLKAYCHPQSSFFAETPPNIRDYGEPFKEAMWLNLVKERLAEKVYTVAWFLRDMRLIFRNHQAFYKASDFGQVGLDLEAEFEKDLKEVLVFHKANENSFQAPP